MPAAEATIVDAGGRDLRVSNPSREIFPATDRSGRVTKLDIVEYYLAVDDGIMRALRHGDEKFEGEDTCLGQVGNTSCERVLRYVGTATYRS